ncbi:MAG TPA: ATP-binding protein [Thermoanaerobaculia bacterium]|nr:ATP-binding protein [Thermoanaerobaculia bacterium]
MSLRGKIIAYLIALNLIVGTAAIFVLLERPLLLFLVEALFVIEIAVSIRLVRAFFVPLELIRTGAELIAERDFTSRFVPVGQPEMDTLIEVYNRMIDRLRDERLAAEEQHQLLQKIVEASPAGIVICDFDGKVERVNPAAARMDYTSVLASLHGEEKAIAHVGTRRLKVSRAMFRDRGFMKQFYVIEEMTEELRLSEKSAYEKLIRIMSHEVNNSVGAVRSLLESSLRYAPQVGETDREDFTNALTIASARIDALNRFMSAFADVVRIPPPHRTPTNVAALVTRVAALLRVELESRAIDVTLDLRDERMFDLDASQLEQVVLNVFRNAMEAIVREGRIHATLRDGVLAVRDSGPGIADSARTELFMPFFTTKRDGRGLGLTVVQEVLANHGFPFSLKNAEGGGAEFSVKLTT